MTEREKVVLAFGSNVIANSIQLATNEELISALVGRGLRRINLVGRGDVFAIEMLTKDGESAGEFADDIQNQIKSAKSILLIKTRCTPRL